MIRIEPMLGMGTWGMGGLQEPDRSTFVPSVEALRYGLSKGLKIIDTAEFYAQGLSEKVVGEAIQKVPRENVYIITKVWQTNLRYDDVLYSAHASLKRLNTSFIDLYLIHWPNDEIPLQETMRAMETLVERGIIKEIGVSNFDVPLMEEARSYLRNSPLAANQIEYSLAQRTAEEGIIPYCSEHGIQVIAYRPLARGILAREMGMLHHLAHAHHKTPAQVALNWILSQGIIAIPRALDPEHIEENLGALGWHLSPDEIQDLRV